jgi:hypothetical protein
LQADAHEIRQSLEAFGEQVACYAACDQDALFDVSREIHHSIRFIFEMSSNRRARISAQHDMLHFLGKERMMCDLIESCQCMLFNRNPSFGEVIGRERILQSLVDRTARQAQCITALDCEKS